MPFVSNNRSVSFIFARSCQKIMVSGGLYYRNKVFSVLALFIFTALIGGYASAQPTLLTPEQRQVDEKAVALLNDPRIVAARAEAIKLWRTLPQFETADGKNQLDGAINEAVYNAVRTAVSAAEASPEIIWSFAPPYSYGDLKIPGSRYGESPDRIYRVIMVDPSSRYVVRGKRNDPPSENDFRFEAMKGFIKTLSDLPSSEVDVSADGSFAITVDSSPKNGRRNHLTLPPGTESLLFRDNLRKWNDQLPNKLSVERLDGSSRVADIFQTIERAVVLINHNAKIIYEGVKTNSGLPPNQITLNVRPSEDGLAGALIGAAPFRLKDDEVLVLKIDQQGADYVSVMLSDPWFRSLPYWDSIISSSNFQAKRGSDGTFTFVISPRDPGYYNWLSTTGLNNGIITIRVENGAPADPSKVIRSAAVVKLSDLASVVSADVARVTPAERAQQLAERKAGYERRLTD